jgi:hypothetical protein
VTYYAYTLVWPLLTAVLAAALLLSLRSLLMRARPTRRLHRSLFDRKELSRHPVRFVIAWIAVVGVWLACTALIYGIADKALPRSADGGHEHDHAH